MFGCFIKLCFLLRQVFMSKMLDQYQGNEKQRWHHSIKQTSNLTSIPASTIGFSSTPHLVCHKTQTTAAAKANQYANPYHCHSNRWTHKVLSAIHFMLIKVHAMGTGTFTYNAGKITSKPCSLKYEEYDHINWYTLEDVYKWHFRVGGGGVQKSPQISDIVE